MPVEIYIEILMLNIPRYGIVYAVNLNQTIIPDSVILTNKTIKSGEPYSSKSRFRDSNSSYRPAVITPTSAALF